MLNQDIITIAQNIRSRILALKNARENEIHQAGLEKAEAIADYEKAIAVTMIALRNGAEVELDGKSIQDPPSGLIEKIARGVCWKQKLRVEKAEAMYKSIITNMNALQAEMNGYQSINKYLSEV